MSLSGAIVRSEDRRCSPLSRRSQGCDRRWEKLGAGRRHFSHTRGRITTGMRAGPCPQRVGVGRSGGERRIIDIALGSAAIENRGIGRIELGVAGKPCRRGGGGGGRRAGGGGGGGAGRGRRGGPRE